MRSYLSILAARSVNQTPQIRPRVASLFESAGPRIKLLERIVKKQVVQPRRANESGHERAEPASVAEDFVGREKTARTSRTDIRPAAFEAAGRLANLQLEIKPVSQPPPSPPIRVSSRQPESESEPAKDEQRFETPDPKEARSQPAAIQTESAHDEPPPIALIEETNLGGSAPEPASPGPISTGRPRREPALRAGVVIRPEIVTSEPKAPALEALPPSQEAQQSIRITIGRVDVRAIMPQPATATNAIRKAVTVGPMSLEEYLKRRNGAAS